MTTENENTNGCLHEHLVLVAIDDSGGIPVPFYRCAQEACGQMVEIQLWRPITPDYVRLMASALNEREQAEFLQKVVADVQLAGEDSM